MEEFETMESVENENVETFSGEEDTNMSGTTGKNNWVLGLGMAAFGAAAGLAWNKFGPTVKGHFHDKKVIRLQKKSERLAKEQLKVEAELQKAQAQETEEK